MDESKTQLRKRWKQEEFLTTLAVPRDRAPRRDELQGLDLRGVPKLANGEPLWHFRLGSVEVADLDLSYGDGVLDIYRSSVSGMKCVEFKFDRASRLRDSELVDCDFRRSRIRGTAWGCRFVRCDFELSTLVGGISGDSGFRDCTFEDCSLRGIRWNGPHFYTSVFERCDFAQARMIEACVYGFRHRSCPGLSSDVFFGGEPRLTALD